MFKLVVTIPFAGHLIGDEITDKDQINEILQNNPEYVRRVAAEQNAPVEKPNRN